MASQRAGANWYAGGMSVIRAAGLVLVWTVALMSGVLSIAREWVATFAPGLVETSPLFNACLLTSFVLSCGYLWVREHSIVKKLNTELTRERSNLVGCPQMTLRYKRTTDYEQFYVRNSGTDGISLQLDRIESRNYVLTSEVIHHVDSGANLLLMLHAVRKDCDRRFDGMAAWKEFAQDVWIAAHPDNEPMSDLDKVNKWFNEMLESQIVIPVRLSYADLSGRWYYSPARVVYSPMPNGAVVEVRPDPIMRKEG